MEQPKQEICSIRIMFPVTSDEQAIDYKKKISAMLKDIPDATIQFSIISGRPPMGAT
ncbi:unnamed protein product [marine sediment metagenome]|uniref:Uncharacterized protein n=1 Tax=marine sediment metagenome TaxID=412755 RepID=X0YDY9_9ZZZZ